MIDPAVRMCWVCSGWCQLSAIQSGYSSRLQEECFSKAARWHPLTLQGVNPLDAGLPAWAIQHEVSESVS